MRSGLTRSFENALVQQVGGQHGGARCPRPWWSTRPSRWYSDYAQRVYLSQGFRFEDYLNMMGTTLDQMRQQAKESAGRQVRQNLALEAIVADAEGFEITDDEVEAEIARAWPSEYDMRGRPGTRRRCLWRT